MVVTQCVISVYLVVHFKAGALAHFYLYWPVEVLAIKIRQDKLCRGIKFAHNQVPGNASLLRLGFTINFRLSSKIFVTTLMILFKEISYFGTIRKSLLETSHLCGVSGWTKSKKKRG